ncbi:MAG: YbhB/YbcL family Raf kinase inhibitor-like protein [Thermodesulfobacteriota bacterium]|nr:YbhB/YbcL family Raf kinase inhibitor-like protein [Thermodesulfobacteriota bacterium]
MKLRSNAFEHEGKIPSQYTCDGKNINPQIVLEDVPAEAQSLALIMDDPDVPPHIREDGMWDHWVVFNIPPDVRDLPEGKTPPGKEGMGTHGDSGYFGPCPPDREHRYFFKAYALDTMLDLPEKMDKLTLEKAMTDHVLDKCVLMGRYERTGDKHA